jgi:hypothetical protein
MSFSIGVKPIVFQGPPGCNPEKSVPAAHVFQGRYKAVLVNGEEREGRYF